MARQEVLSASVGPLPAAVIARVRTHLEAARTDAGICGRREIIDVLKTLADSMAQDVSGKSVLAAEAEIAAALAIRHQ
jgi:hypothetical protein